MHAVDVSDLSTASETQTYRRGYAGQLMIWLLLLALLLMPFSAAALTPLEDAH